MISPSPSRAMYYNIFMEEHMNKDTAAQRGIDRKEHFEGGGTLSGWRGVHQVASDRRREASRMACRRPQKDLGD